MTIDEAIYCMKAYLPEERLERCINCPYYKSYPICEVDDDTELCKSSEAHKMAIEALERMKDVVLHSSQ